MTDPRTNDPQHDRELDNYLAGRHALSVRYLEASRETAPPELDAAILASARAAVAHAPRRRSRWRVPLAAAATMVLGVSLVLQLRDEAVPDAVRAGHDAARSRQAPVAASAPAPEAEAESFATLSADTVADSVAPSAMVPAPPAEQARRIAPSGLPAESGARRRQEPVAGSAMAKAEAAGEAAEQRERSAPAELPRAAPQARAFALAPAPLPAATLDEISIAARELLGLLRSGNTDAVVARAPASARAAIVGALPRFADAHAAQVLADRGEGWRIVYRDAAGRRIGIAVVEASGGDWQLLQLEADAPERGVE